MFLRISRWIDEEEDKLKDSAMSDLQYVILDMSGESFDYYRRCRREVKKVTLYLVCETLFD